MNTADPPTHPAFDCANLQDFLAKATEAYRVLGRTLFTEHLWRWAEGNPRSWLEYAELAVWAQSSVADGPLCRQLAERAAQLTDSPQQLRRLIGRLLEAGAAAHSLRSLYERQGSRATEVPAQIHYAEGFLALFDDEPAARRALNGLAPHCADVPSLVQLAAGYRHLFSDVQQVRSTLARAESLAATVEDRVRVAEAYWKLLQDRVRTGKLYAQAVSRTDAPRMLLAIGKAVLSELGERELAREAYSRAAQSAAGTADLLLLARAVQGDLAEPALVQTLLDRAEGSLSSIEERRKLLDGLQRHFPGEGSRIVRLQGSLDDPTSRTPNVS